MYLVGRFSRKNMVCRQNAEEEYGSRQNVEEEYGSRQNIEKDYD
jgi:hypothetical protein